MGIYIGMKKTAEDNETVSYVFDMLVVDRKHFTDEDPFASKVPSRRAYGYCIFNKKTQELTLDKEKTDPYFIEKKHDPYVMRVWGKLLDIQESGEKFPETTCYAS